MPRREQVPFDFEEHERQLALRYEQLAKYDAFDKLIDLALDGVITMADAQTAWESELHTFDGVEQ